MNRERGRCPTGDTVGLLSTFLPYSLTLISCNEMQEIKEEPLTGTGTTPEHTAHTDILILSKEGTEITCTGTVVIPLSKGLADEMR